MPTFNIAKPVCLTMDSYKDGTKPDARTCNIPLQQVSSETYLDGCGIRADLIDAPPQAVSGIAYIHLQH